MVTVEVPENTRISRPYKLTGSIIWLLEKIYDTRPQSCKLAYLKTLPTGTVGREVAGVLKRKDYRLIPKFDNHDLKHIVLGYNMIMEDELRMQAYLIGNGNYTVPCLLFLSLAIFYPGIWKDLPNSFKQGKQSKSIHFLMLDDCMGSDLTAIKSEFGRK